MRVGPLEGGGRTREVIRAIVEGRGMTDTSDPLPLLIMVVVGMSIGVITGLHRLADMIVEEIVVTGDSILIGEIWR